MSFSSRLSPRLKPSFRRLPQIAKTASALAFIAGVLSLAGCGGETGDDGSTASVTANSLPADTVANAATDPYSNGVVPPDNGSPPVQANGQPYNRALVQRAGQGD